MHMQQATRSYDTWMSSHIRPVEKDLRSKHTCMKGGLFPFFRGSYYLWAYHWKTWAPTAAKAPLVLAVGDLHVENFGTWRDSDGRLIWGINDFDEAWRLPYTSDLLRLATSALVAEREDHLAIRASQSTEAILEGYRDALQNGGEPFVLGEHHASLRQLAESGQRDPVVFWRNMDKVLDAKFPGRKCGTAKNAILQAMPSEELKVRFAPRIAGVGSLGRERWVGVADWCGGRVAREAKAILPSAHVWAEGLKDGSCFYSQIVNEAVRCPDPFLQIGSQWVVRRLSPSNSRIDLAQLPRDSDAYKILYSMGWETANIHLGSRAAAKDIRNDLAKRPAKWLYDGASQMAAQLTEEWQRWVSKR